MEIGFHDEHEFDKWLTALAPEPRDLVLAKLLLLREHGIAIGMPLVRRITAGLHELRVGGNRVYFTQVGGTIHVLTQGRKDTQARDIERARRRMP